MQLAHLNFSLKVTPPSNADFDQWRVGPVETTMIDRVERLRQTRLWYLLSPQQQADFLENPKDRPRLFQAWSRLSRSERQEFRRQAASNHDASGSDGIVASA